MFNYTEEQKCCEFEEVKIGGQPGVLPTLMIGSIFYENQFQDLKTSKKEAIKLIEEQRNLSKITSVPSLVDIFIYEKEEIDWKLDFALDNIDGMFSLDMPESEVRIEVLKRLDEMDALDRVVYNSLNLGLTDEEEKRLREKPPRSTILLGYNPQKNNTQGRLEIIENGGKLMEKGLLPLAEDIGIDFPLLDTAATPFGEKACEGLRAIPVFKNEFGLPTGCAFHNTVESWNWLKNYEKKEEIFNALDTSINNLPVLFGADFIYYGPIENSSIALPNIAMINKLLAEGAEDYFGEDINKNHPYYSL